MTKKKTNVDKAVDYANKMVPEEYRHHITERAERMRELGNQTTKEWTDALIENNFHKTTLVVSFVAGMLENVAKDIFDNLREKIEEEQLEAELEKNPDLKGN